MSEAVAPLASRSPKSIAVDNLLRRDLRIGDPNDPAQIAQGLLARYPDVLDQMRREREGINYGDPDLAPTPSGSASAGAWATELSQAGDDLDRDIQTLSTSSELKEIDVEMKGWGRAVRQAASDGLAAATLALDPVQSDRAMAARRTLGDYARLARYVGALSADTAPLFRQFAQSCDVMAAMVLVGIGDGLAANGVTRSTALIRVSASELQSRRNAVMLAFQTITGTAQVPTGQDEYPRGLEAYRILTRQLELSGQSDLRTLLDEASLASELDQLVDLAVGATASGLRELSTTSLIVVDRLTRLVRACRARAVPMNLVGRVSPESPPMTYFASALQLFIDAFTVTNGGRLLFVARPPILAYGLYRAGPDDATERLIRLTLDRGTIAEQADCLASCNCDLPTIICTLLLDYLLYRLDRAIDLYAVGYQFEGEARPEIIAANLAFTISGFLTATASTTTPPPTPPFPSRSMLSSVFSSAPPPAIPPLLTTALQDVQAQLLLALAASSPGGIPDAATTDLLVHELSAQFHVEQQLDRVVQSLSLRCVQGAVLSSRGSPSFVQLIIRAAVNGLGHQITPDGSIFIPPDVSSTLATIAHNRAFYAQS
jgi:hypothetical protein